jgi:ABC-2 type transport system ATP-binding protein
VGGDGTTILTEAVRRLDDEQIKLADIGLRRPSLDDVFLSLTGHAAEDGADGAGEEPSQDGGRSRGRKKERT